MQQQAAEKEAIVVQEKWAGGKIEIELLNSQCQFRTGAVIRGRLIVTQTEDFEGTEIQVGLNGSEITFFKEISPERH